MRLILSLILIFNVFPLKALVLENLIKEGKLKSTFEEKTVGYYVGSFDPLHLGHQDIAALPIEEGLVDYVLVMPSWGGDTYKKRADVAHRLDMLFAAFKDHPTIIVTRLSPLDLQRALTISDPQRLVHENPTVKPKFKGTTFIGIVGADTALQLDNNDEALATFMSGIDIPEIYKEHTLGGLMALPVDSFIVAKREGEDITSLHQTIGDRPIQALIKSKLQKSTSSTLVKETLREGLPIEPFVGADIATIIQNNKLYR